MRYYLLQEDKKYQNRPQIQNIMKIIEPRELYERNYSRIPKRVILPVTPNKKIDYLDILTYPFLLVNKKIHSLLEIYEPNLQYKEAVLLDKKYGTVGEYFLPLVKTVDCLGEDTTFNLDHSEFLQVQINRKNLKDECIFALIEGNRGVYVIRQDLAESILRRENYGFSMTEVKYENSEVEKHE